jgi:RNA polymerase sigma-70 factor (ECF subfamily)
MTTWSPVADIADEALAQAATRGDDTAFRLLYLRHHRHVLSSVTRLIGAGPDREDVTQEVFLQLHRALPRFRGDAQLSTFLRRIVVYVALDHVRRRYRARRLDGDPEALDTIVDVGNDPERRSSARQELAAVLRHIDRMPLEPRGALLLVAIAGLSNADAASHLGASADVIKQRVLRARRQLTARRARTAPCQEPSHGVDCAHG